MDKTLQTTFIFDGITAIFGLIFLTAVWFVFKAGFSYWKLVRDGKTMSVGEIIEHDKLVQTIFVRTALVVFTFAFLLFWINRETVWFRPEPAPVANPERAEKIDENLNKEIVINDPVNVGERQKLDPEDLAVKDKVEEMDDLAGGPENQ